MPVVDVSAIIRAQVRRSLSQEVLQLCMRNYSAVVVIGGLRIRAEMKQLKIFLSNDIYQGDMH